MTENKEIKYQLRRKLIRQEIVSQKSVVKQKMKESSIFGIFQHIGLGIYLSRKIKCWPI